MASHFDHDVLSRRWRLIETTACEGSRNMAIDQTLLESAEAEGARFVPTLRFYRWSPPAISLGRFQDISDIDVDACSSKGIDVVRRPTGGKCILHLDDFTYSLVLAPDIGLPDNVVEAYTLLCQGIVESLRRLGLNAVIQSRMSDDYSSGGGACFSAVTQADLECDGRKICGSAQVRRSGAVLQHGSILMVDNSRLLFDLLSYQGRERRERALRDYRQRCVDLNSLGCRASWDDIAACFKDGFSHSFDIELESGRLTGGEEAGISMLEKTYSSRDWLMGTTSHGYRLS
ncbi:MAG: biotin/lipoate A/B protein ligase family protein [Actinomycetota bacterium]|nr:biotin/lipoate A/B protein ligase family protein [Actinomycetota bacterium]